MNDNTILLDVWIPPLGKKYEFELNVQTPIRNLIRDIQAILSEEENVKFGTEHGILFSFDQEHILDSDKNLSEEHITGGQLLLLA